MQVIGIDSATSAMVLAETQKERKHPGWYFQKGIMHTVAKSHEG